MTFVTLCTIMLILLLYWMKVYRTWLACEFCLSDTKLKYQKNPLPNKLKTKTKAFLFSFYLALSLSLSLSWGGCVHISNSSPPKSSHYNDHLILYYPKKKTISCYNDLMGSTVSSFPLEEHLDGQGPSNGGVLCKDYTLL